MPRPRYDLLALDLDGTLLDPSGRVSSANRAAVAAARDAGITVAVCTGRGLVECRDALDAIGQADPVVVAGGSIVADPPSGRTLHRFPIDLGLVRRTVTSLNAHDHPALVFKDAAAAGFDYLVVTPRGPDAIDPATRWWFENMDIKVRVVPSLDEDDHPEYTVRVGVCAQTEAVDRIAAELRDELEDRANLHVYPAVVHGSGPEYQIPPSFILEVFDRSATKWTGISWLARQRAIAPERIAAIGDQVNDFSMISAAGLGIAMGNAIPELRDAARRHTLDNSRDGVAYAIDRILDGAW